MVVAIGDDELSVAVGGDAGETVEVALAAAVLAEGAK